MGADASALLDRNQQESKRDSGQDFVHMGRFWSLHNQSTPHQNALASTDANATETGHRQSRPSWTLLRRGHHLGPPRPLCPWAGPCENRGVSSEMNPGPYSDQYPDEYSPQSSPYSASSGSSGSSASSAPAAGGASGANEDVASLSYERAREELVAVVQRLEAGSVPLEDSLALWERGEALAQRCQTWLDEARARLAAVAQEDPED